ncbi:MAG: hypothetical protein HYS98_01425 [Deltaproteobacteria bacterium]|nr:hypothetical protein [Deltaproteobacteria bacterium]
MKNNNLGQAITEYILMISVLVGLLIGAGLIFNKQLAPIFAALKERLKYSIIGGGLEERKMWQHRKSQEQEPQGSQIPEYPTTQPQRRQGDTSSD